MVIASTGTLSISRNPSSFDKGNFDWRCMRLLRFSVRRMVDYKCWIVVGLILSLRAYANRADWSILNLIIYISRIREWEACHCYCAFRKVQVRRLHRSKDNHNLRDAKVVIPVEESHCIWLHFGLDFYEKLMISGYRGLFIWWLWSWVISFITYSRI